VERPNGAADKPRKARKPQAFSPEVGLIRVVVRRFAPSNLADCNPPPRGRGREASATTSDYMVPHNSTVVELCGKTRPAEKFRRIVCMKGRCVPVQWTF
jgi:hypothetical protein